MRALQEIFDRDYVPDCDGNQHGGLLALLRDVRKLARMYDLDFEVACDQSDAADVAQILEVGQIWQSVETGNRWLIKAFLADGKVQVEALDGGRFAGCDPHYAFNPVAFKGPNAKLLGKAGA